MRLMCADHCSKWYLDLTQRFPDNLGWLCGPSCHNMPRSNIPFALDNDAYQSFTNGTPYDLPAWFKFLDRINALDIQPIWALCPDTVGNRETTIEQWRDHSDTIRSYGWTTAFAVQDGMTRDDVLDLKPRPNVLFVGGTTAWKWSTAHLWCRAFNRVHVGRVNGKKRLWHCQRIGAESCDGSGWTRGTTKGREARQLEAWLENQEPHPELAIKL